MTPEEYDIAIIGGGLVGASLARLLASSGQIWRVALLDRRCLSADASTHYGPDYDNRSTALAAGSVELFQRLGLWPRLSRHATAIREVQVSDQGHLGGALINAGEQGREALGYVLENAWLAPCLQEAALAAPGVTHLAPVQVTELHPGAEASSLTLTPEAGADSQLPRSLRARLVILADGGASSLREQLGIGLKSTNYGQTALVANVSFSEPHRGVAYERFTAEGPMALLPLDETPQGQRGALIWTLPPGRARALQEATGTTFLAELQRQFGWRLGRFERLGERHAWPLQLVEAREQVRSRLVLLGNSAHYLHPVAGQGLNLSLRDAAALAQTLSQARDEGRDPGSLDTLQAYLDERRWDQAVTVSLSDRLVRVFSTRRTPLVALRHLGFLALDTLPGARQVFAAQTMGTLEPLRFWPGPEMGAAGPALEVMP